jgi:uncharacterized protein DUF6477
MANLLTLLQALRRPRLLIRAARYGVADYNRKRDLKRLISVDITAAPDQTVSALMDQEARIDARRKSGDHRYSPARHVEVLIALMAEARLLPGGL